MERPFTIIIKDGRAVCTWADTHRRILTRWEVAAFVIFGRFPKP
jgi:hypothetical protein